MDLGLTLAPESQQRHGTSDTPLDDDATFWNSFHDYFNDPSTSADVQDFAALASSNDQQPDLQTAGNGYHVAYSMIQQDTTQGQKRTIEETGFELEQGTDSASAGPRKKLCIEDQAPASRNDAHTQASQPRDLPGAGHFTAPYMSSGPSSEVDILQIVPALPQAASALTTHNATGNGFQVRAASCDVSAEYVKNLTGGRRHSEARSEPCKSRAQPISAPLSLPRISSQNHGLPTPSSSERRSSAGGNSTDEKGQACTDREKSVDSLFDEDESYVDITGEESAVRITNQTVPDARATPRDTSVDEANTFPNGPPQVAPAAATISLPKSSPEFPVSAPYPAPRASTAVIQNHAIQPQDVVASQSREMLHAVAPPVRHISPYPKHGGPLEYFPSANNLHTRNTEVSHNYLVSRLDETEKRNSRMTYERTKLIAAFRENIELDPATGKTAVQLLKEQVATLKRNTGSLEAQLADSRQRHNDLFNQFCGLESAHDALINQCHFLGFYDHIHAMNQAQDAPTTQQNAPRGPMPANNSPAVYPQRSASVTTVHQAQVTGAAQSIRTPAEILVSPVSNQTSSVVPPPMHTPAGYPVRPTSSGTVPQRGISIMPRPRSATSAFLPPAQQRGHYSLKATGRPVPQSSNHPGTYVSQIPPQVASPSTYTPWPQTLVGAPMVPYTSQGQVRAAHPAASGHLPQQIHGSTPVRPTAHGHMNAATSAAQSRTHATHSAATRPQQPMCAPVPVGPHSSSPVNPARSRTSPITAQATQPVVAQPRQQVQAPVPVGPNAIGAANRAGTPVYPVPVQTVQPLPAEASARPTVPEHANPAVSYASPFPVQATRRVADIPPHSQAHVPNPMMPNPAGPVNPIGTQTSPISGQVALSVERPSNQQQDFAGAADSTSGTTNQITIDLTTAEDSAGAQQATPQPELPTEDRAQEFYKSVRRKDYNWLGDQNHMQQGFQYQPPTHPTVTKSQKARSRPNSRGKATAMVKSSPAKPRGASRPTSRGNATAAAGSPSPVQNGQSVNGAKESSDAEELTAEEKAFALMMEDEFMAS